VLAINTDVTAKRQLEAEFLRVQRMESIGTLAGGIAHDLNNVLAPIMMAVEALEDYVGDAEGRSILATLGDAARRGAELVRQVLTFARGVEGQRLPVNILEVLQGIEKIVGTTFPKNIRFDLAARGAQAMVLGDSTQLHQVFMNLLVNARDALPNGGRIAVRVEPVRVDCTLGGLNPEAGPGDYVMVEVADSGIGISAEARERIFDPFYTTKDPGKGTGLGLSTTLAIVRSHGGFIRVRSEPGQGAVFLVYLPAGVPAASDSPGTAPEPLARGQGELILVVDDEEAIRRISSRVLERHGYRVITAAHGAEAASIYARRKEEITLVLTDMAMPIMDGPALVLALRAINPDVRIIGSSGLRGQGEDDGRPVAGLEHFIPKPYTADGLLAIVRKALREG
jgi:nitrogen-specific signal transduction histidine kinase/CheY-like chemotaxis protein